MRTLMVGAILLMSLLFVGTIQADEGGAASRDVAANPAFTTDIDLYEDAAPVDFNMSGPEGVFTTDAGTTYDFVFDNVTNSTTWDDGNFTGAIATGVVTFTTLTDYAADVGPITVTIWATNQTNHTNVTSVDLAVTVHAMNDMPAITALTDFEATQATEIAVELNGTDEETDWTGFTFTIAQGNETTIDLPDSISVDEADDGSWWLKVNATNDDAIVGEYTVNVTLTDGGSATSVDAVVVTILDDNDAPTLPATWPAETISEFDWMDFYGDYYFEIGPIEDVDFDVPLNTEALTYEAYYCGDGVDTDLFWDDVDGYSCWDGEFGELFVEEIVDIVNDTISAMVMVPIWDHHVAENTNPEVFFVVYDAAGTEANLTIGIDIVEVDDPVGIAPAYEINASMVNDVNVSQDDTLVLGYYGMDMDVDSALVWDFDITLRPAARAETYDYGAAFALNTTAPMAMGDFPEMYDDDTHNFYKMNQEYYAMYGYETDFITVGYTEIVFSPVNLDVGELNVTLTCTDGTWTATENITIIIHNVNDAPTTPTLNIPDGKTGGATNDTGVEFVGFWVNITADGSDDVDLLIDVGEELTYTIDWDDGTVEDATFNATSGGYDLSHLYTVAGEYNLTFTVSDGEASASDGYWINVVSAVVEDPVHVDIVIDYVLVMKDLSDLTAEELADEIMNDPTGFMDMSPGEKGNAVGSYDDDGYGDADFNVWIVFYDKDGVEISREGGVQTDGSFDIAFTVPKGTYSYDVVFQEGEAAEAPVPDSMKTAWGIIDPSSDDGDDDESSMMLILILLIVIILVVVIIVAVVAGKKKAKRKAEEEERRRKEEEAAAAIGTAMERAGYLQSLAAGAQLDLSTMQPQFDDATAKQAEGNNIEANEVITAYNTSIEQALVAQGMDVEAQVAALAAQQLAGELPPDQAAAAGAEGALPPDQAAAYGAEGALPPAEGAIPPDQAVVDPAAAAAADPAAAAPDPAAQSAPCPFCQQPIVVGTPQCAACGNAIQWG